MIPLATWLVFVARVRRARGHARAERAVPRLAHARAGPWRGLRVARGHVERLPAARARRRVRAVGAAGGRPAVAYDTIRIAGAIYLAWLAWTTWRAPDAPANASVQDAVAAGAALSGEGLVDLDPQSQGRDVPAGALSRSSSIPRAAACSRRASSSARRRSSSTLAGDSRVHLRRRGRAPLLRGRPRGAAGRGASSPASSRPRRAARAGRPAVTAQP